MHGVGCKAGDVLHMMGRGDPSPWGPETPERLFLNGERGQQ